MDKIIKALEHEIAVVQKRFDKASDFGNFAEMAVQDAYKEGLEQALEIVKLQKRGEE